MTDRSPHTVHIQRGTLPAPFSVASPAASDRLDMPIPDGAVTGCDAMIGPQDHLAGGYRRSAYMARLDVRQLKDETKRQIVFGLGVGWILTLFSYFQYRFVPFVNETLWLALTAVGIVLLVTAVIIPSLLHWPERAWMAAARLVGKTVFTCLLIAVFFLLITPVGILWRMAKGSTPFYSWTDVPPTGMDGWTKKVVPAEIEAGDTSGRKRSLLVQPARLLAYFVRQGHYLLLPTMVVIIILGLLMFFVHTSTLAPFIYTLF